MTYEEKEQQDAKIKTIVNMFDLKNKSRENRYKWNRQSLMYHLRQLGYTLQEIAKFINVHHATVVHGINRYNELQDVMDSEFQASIYQIEQSLNDLELKPVWVVKKEKKENVFVTLINRIFEAKDMGDIESIKAFINENINPNKL